MDRQVEGPRLSQLKLGIRSGDKGTRGVDGYRDGRGGEVAGSSGRGGQGEGLQGVGRFKDGEECQLIVCVHVCGVWWGGASVGMGCMG